MGAKPSFDSLLAAEEVEHNPQATKGISQQTQERILQKINEPLSEEAKARAILNTVLLRILIARNKMKGKKPSKIWEKVWQGFRGIRERHTLSAISTSEFMNQKLPEKIPLIPGLLNTRDQVCFTGRRRNGDVCRRSGELARRHRGKRSRAHGALQSPCNQF